MNRFKSAFNFADNFREIFQRSDDRLALIDGVRALSILYVLVYHCLIAIMIGYKAEFLEFIQTTPWYFQWVLMGDRGVDSFFVISGFLIGQILFKEHERSGTINLKRFFLRRWLRLTPAYYFVILLAAWFGPWPDKEYLLAFVFYLNNFLDFEHNYIHFAWSLAIEEQFYIIFSIFLVYGFYRIKNRLVFMLILLFSSFIVQALLLAQNPHLLVGGDQLLAGNEDVMAAYWEIIYDNLYTRYGAILSGVILAYIYVYHWSKMQTWMNSFRSNGLLITALACILFILTLPVFNGVNYAQWLVFIYHVMHRDVFSIAIAIIIFVCMFPYGIAGNLNKFLSWKVFFPISQLSYSMYLMHLPVLVAVCLLLRGFKLMDKGLSYENLFIVLGAGIIPVMVVSAIIYVFIEKPFMKLRN